MFRFLIRSKTSSETLRKQPVLVIRLRPYPLRWFRNHEEPCFGPWLVGVRQHIDLHLYTYTL